MEAETMTDLSTTVSRVIAAPRKRVFDAWLDPEMMARFLRGTPDTTVTRAECDPRVGGRFLVMMQTDRDLPHEGTYKEISRPDRLVFTWESAHSTVEDSTVTLTFSDVEGGTLVELTQVRFANEGVRDGHTKGWSHILEKLAEAV